MAINTIIILIAEATAVAVLSKLSKHQSEKADEPVERWAIIDGEFLIMEEA